MSGGYKPQPASRQISNVPVMATGIVLIVIGAAIFAATFTYNHWARKERMRGRDDIWTRTLPETVRAIRSRRPRHDNH